MGYPKDLNDWADDVHNLARRKGWWTDYMVSRGGDGSPAIRELSADQVLSKLMLIVTDVAEAAEEVRRLNFDPRLSRRSEDGKPEGFPTELADIVIRVFDLAKGCGVDIEMAIRTKHIYNETRPIRHGGKRA